MVRVYIDAFDHVLRGGQWSAVMRVKYEVVDSLGRVLLPSTWFERKRLIGSASTDAYVQAQDESIAEFIDAIDRINGIGKRSPGFVWMLEGSGSPGATSHAISGDPCLVPNLTVWEDARSLQDYVFRTIHSRFLGRRTEWFVPLGQPHFVMWWVEPGHRPTLDEALERLEELRRLDDVGALEQAMRSEGLPVALQPATRAGRAAATGSG